MLTVRGIETRLRKLEAKRRPAEGVFFLVWGRSPAEIEQAVTAAKTSGTIVRGDTVVRAVWTGHNGGPPSRWIANCRSHLSPAEDDGLFEEMKRRGVEAYGAEAVAEVLARPIAHPDTWASRLTDAQLFAAALGESPQVASAAQKTCFIRPRIWRVAGVCLAVSAAVPL